MARDWKGIIFRGCMVVQFCRSEHTGTQLVQHRVLSWIIGKKIYLKFFWAPEMPFSICSVSDIIGFFGIQYEQSWRYRNRIAWRTTYKRQTFLTHHVEANVIVLSNSRNILFQTWLGSKNIPKCVFWKFFRAQSQAISNEYLLLFFWSSVEH